MRRRRPQPGLIFHTDRGIEYRGFDLRALLARYAVIPSMNRPGQCTDNATMESFFHTLKAELIWRGRFESVAILRRKLAGYIHHFYNQKRLHSALGYRSPLEYELREEIMATAKEQLAQILAQQPDDSSYDELVRELAFSVMVQRGLTDSDMARTISNDEMHQRIRSWRK